MRRFLPGVVPPKPYPLGIIGPADMDPALLPFVIKVVNKLTWRLPNLEILVHGFKDRLSHSIMGGVETVAALYAKRYWYTLKVYRRFKTVRLKDRHWGDFIEVDGEFFRDAAGFIAFDDGSNLVRQHIADAQSVLVKKVKVYEIN